MWQVLGHPTRLIAIEVGSLEAAEADEPPFPQHQPGEYFEAFEESVVDLPDPVEFHDHPTRAMLPSDVPKRVAEVPAPSRGICLVGEELHEQPVRAPFDADVVAIDELVHGKILPWCGRGDPP
jgi:hypothetical protein